MLKIYLIFTIIIGGVISAFFHQTKGLINKLDKFIGRLYILVLVASVVVMYLKYGMVDALIIIGLFMLSELVFNLIFSFAFKMMK